MLDYTVPVFTYVCQAGSKHSDFYHLFPKMVQNTIFSVFMTYSEAISQAAMTWPGDHELKERSRQHNLSLAVTYNTWYKVAQQG